MDREADATRMSDKKEQDTKKKKKEFLFRLLPEKEKEMRAAVAAEGITLQAFFERAIDHEIARSASLGRRLEKLDKEQELAYLFMQCVPTPMVIKNDRGEILWANVNYQRLLGLHLSELEGRRLDQLNILGWEGSAVEADIRQALESRSRSGDWCLEPLLIRNDKLLFGVCRYVFQPEKRGPWLLGDVSFEWRTVRDGARPIDPTHWQRIAGVHIPSGTEKLFAAFLKQNPLAVAIKDAEGKLRYCNDVYTKLVRQPAGTLLGRTTRDIFSLDESHGLLKEEESVVRNKWWMYTRHALGKSGTRVCLRFPVFQGDELPLLGVISTSIRSGEFPLVFTQRKDLRRGLSSRRGGSRSSGRTTTRR